MSNTKTKLKFALIIDKSQPYVDFKKDELLKDWGVEPADMKNVKGLSEVGSSTLFGKAPTALLTLPELTSVKDFLKALEEIEKAGNIESITGEGLIVMTVVGRVSTKKLEALVDKLGGQVIIAKPGANERMTVGEKIIHDLSFTREVKNYILNHVGDDYEALIPIVKSLSDISKDSHKKITVEDMYIRLPKAPGSVPPWEIEKPLFAGDITTTIEIFRRVNQNSSLLVILAILKKKIDLAYRASAIASTDPKMSKTAIAEALDVPDNYALTIALGYGKKYGLMSLLQLAELMTETERKVKGGSAIPGDIAMEIMLVEFQRILKG